MYHGGEGGDAGHEGGGGDPAAAGEEAVEGGDGERPLEGELEPDEAAEEAGGPGHEVVPVLGGAPALELHERRRVEARREDGLRVHQRGRDGDGEREDRDGQVRHRRDDAHRHPRAPVDLLPLRPAGGWLPQFFRLEEEDGISSRVERRELEK